MTSWEGGSQGIMSRGGEMTIVAGEGEMMSWEIASRKMTSREMALREMTSLGARSAGKYLQGGVRVHRRRHCSTPAPLYLPSFLDILCATLLFCNSDIFLLCASLYQRLIRFLYFYTLRF